MRLPPFEPGFAAEFSQLGPVRKPAPLFDGIFRGKLRSSRIPPAPGRETRRARKKFSMIGNKIIYANLVTLQGRTWSRRGSTGRRRGRSDRRYATCVERMFPESGDLCATGFHCILSSVARATRLPAWRRVVCHEQRNFSDDVSRVPTPLLSRRQVHVPHLQQMRGANVHHLRVAEHVDLPGMPQPVRRTCGAGVIPAA